MTSNIHCAKASPWHPPPSWVASEQRLRHASRAIFPVPSLESLVSKEMGGLPMGHLPGGQPAMGSPCPDPCPCRGANPGAVGRASHRGGPQRRRTRPISRGGSHSGPLHRRRPPPSALARVQVRPSRLIRRPLAGSGRRLGDEIRATMRKTTECSQCPGCRIRLSSYLQQTKSTQEEVRQERVASKMPTQYSIGSVLASRIFSVSPQRK